MEEGRALVSSEGRRRGGGGGELAKTHDARETETADIIYII